MIYYSHMECVKQTGLLIKPPTPTEYVMGAFTKIKPAIRVPSGKWGPYLPTYEKQYNYSFDTLSCTTFSALNSVEMQLNWLMKNGYFSQLNIEQLTSMGYLDENKLFNFSDRFTAIQSGTTRLGNYFTVVWESIRTVGLLPEKDFPFGDCKTWEEYHDSSKITQSMITKAKKFLDIIQIQYEWVFYKSDESGLTENEENTVDEAMTQAPMQIGIAIPATHAILQYSVDRDVLDTYPPFIYLYPITSLVHFGLKGYVSLKENLVQYVFTKKMIYGMIDTQIVQLQKFLNSYPNTQIALTGPGSIGKETNYFGLLTKQAVMTFQRLNGLEVDGIFGLKSAQKAEELQKKR